MLLYLKKSSFLILLFAIAASPILVLKPEPWFSPEVAKQKRLMAIVEDFQADPDNVNSAHKLREYLKAAKELGLDTPGYYESLLYYLDIRTWPSGVFPQEAYVAAAAMRDELNRDTTLGGNRWEYVGPKNLKVPSNQYFGRGPLSGRINAIAFHPDDANKYFVATSSGGVWKTENDGQSWTALSDNWPNMQTSTIALKPGDPNKIWVGLGDFHGRRPPYSFGIRESTDGGATWSTRFEALSGNNMVSKILFDPEDPEVIHVTTGKGRDYLGSVYRTANGGRDWQEKLVGTRAAWADVVYGALDPRTGVRHYYVAGQAFNNGEVHRSSDKGRTWTKLTLPSTFPNADYIDCVEVAASLVDPDTVYVALARSPRGAETTEGSVAQRAWAGKCKIYKSTKAGATDSWTDITAGLPANEGGYIGYNWSQCDYDAHLTPSYKLDRNNRKRDVIYFGLITLARYDDETNTWRDIGQTYDIGNSELHNDQHSMAIFPTDPNKILVGCDGGLYKATYDAVNDKWTFPSLNGGADGLRITEFYHADFHPTNKDMVVGGTQDNAGPASVARVDGNWVVTTDTWSNISGGDGNYVAIDASAPNKQYATNNSTRFRKTENLWENQRNIASPPLVDGEMKSFVAIIALDQRDPRWLYYVAEYLRYYRIHQSDWRDRNATLNQKICGPNAYGTAVTVAPSDSNEVYTGSLDGQLWRFHFNTATGKWEPSRVNKGKTNAASLPALPITSIAVHPERKFMLYVTLGGNPLNNPPPGTVERVWMCPDVSKPENQREWKAVSGTDVANRLNKVTANWIGLHPDRPLTDWYVATDVGLYVTSNGGGRYASEGASGLPNVPVRTVKVVKHSATSTYVYAATYGRGIWRKKL